MTMTSDETTTRYECIIFMQGDDAYDVLDQLANVSGVVMHGATDESVRTAMEYLLQWDYGEGHDVRDSAPWGTRDETETTGDLVLSWNYGLGYVSLTRVIRDA